MGLLLQAHLGWVIGCLHQVLSLLLLLLLVVLFTLDVGLVGVVRRHLAPVGLAGLQVGRVVGGVSRVLVTEVLSGSRRLSIIVTSLSVHMLCLGLWRALSLNTAQVLIDLLIAFGNRGATAVNGRLGP